MNVPFVKKAILCCSLGVSYYLICLCWIGIALFLFGCSSGGGGNAGYQQSPHFARDMKDEHIGTAVEQYQRVGKPGELVGRKSWSVLFCVPEGSRGRLGDYSCNCPRSEGACVHAWDSTGFGSQASTRLYAGPNPKNETIRHEEAHATIATWCDDPAEVLAHPTGHPEVVRFNGRPVRIKRDLIPGTRWPLILRGPWHAAFGGGDSWEEEYCGYRRVIEEGMVHESVSE